MAKLKKSKECSYHLCENKGNLVKCDYCEKKFCKEHIEARPASVQGIGDDYINDKGKKLNNSNSHPCIPFIDIIREKEKLQKWRENEALNKALKKPLKKEVRSEIIIENEDNVNEFEDEICNYCERRVKNIHLCQNCGQYFCYEHSNQNAHNCKVVESETSWNKDNIVDKDDEIKDFDGISVNMTKYKNSNNTPFKFEKKGIIHFLKKYISFRIPPYINHYLNSFMYIFLIGLVLNFVYYQKISIFYLFIDGLTDLLNLLANALNNNITPYNLFALFINGIFYFVFYSRFIKLIYTIIKNLDSWDVWIMLIWFALIGYLSILIFPSVI